VAHGAMSLTALSSVQGVLSVDLPTYSVARSPRRFLKSNSMASNQGITQGVANTMIDGTAIAIMHADQFISATAITGSGITVGVMSGDATNIARIQAAGELPASITQYPATTNPNPTDEGTVMLEEFTP
jgi:uncharacterized Zn-binding protein involved in type VI secretion